MITPFSAKAVLYFDGFALGVFGMFWLVLAFRGGSAPTGALVARNFMGGAVVLIQAMIACFFFVSPGLDHMAWRAILTFPSWPGSAASPLDPLSAIYGNENVLNYATWVLSGVVTAVIVLILAGPSLFLQRAGTPRMAPAGY
jgi:hypothetical protein